MTNKHSVSLLCASALALAAGIATAAPVTAVTLADPDPIAVGTNPFDLALTPNEKKLYVTNSASGTVSVIDTTDNSVSATIPSFSVPVTVDVSPNGKSAYVFDSTLEEMVIVSTKHDAVVKRFDVSPNSEVCRINPKASLFGCATSSTPNRLEVYSAKNGRLLSSIEISGEGFDVDFAKNGKRAYVTENYGNEVFVVDLKRKREVDIYATDTGGLWSDLTANGNRLFVANYLSDTVTVLDTKTGQESVGIAMGSGCMPASVTLLADDSYAFVPCFGTGRINVIQTSNYTLWGFMGVTLPSSGIDSIVVNKSGTMGYTTSFLGNAVWALSDFP